jgi:hypothetical protein
MEILNFKINYARTECMESIGIYKMFGAFPEKKDANLYMSYKRYFEQEIIID